MNTTAIAIIAIICWAIVSITNGTKKSGKVTKQQSLDNDELRNEIASMKDRIATLEAIVTDEKYNLKREFDNLSKNDAA